MARLEHGEIRPLHVLAEKVQLGKGLKNHQLADDAVARGLACLERFQQLLASVRPDKIRAVGTNALRQAHNREVFTEPAEAILGVSVDVIYGREEARLLLHTSMVRLCAGLSSSPLLNGRHGWHSTLLIQAV